MFYERSISLRVSAWLLAIDSTPRFASCGFLPQGKTVSALARNPLSDRFLCPLKESGHGINNISFREIKIILFM
jgi:hypothetical protein